ncbi:MAG: serine/threonine-protein kinase [Spirulinaceae cyanobacterium]
MIIPPGTLLRGRYRVIASLSKGGFAKTYEVVDEKDNNTSKVVKILELDRTIGSKNKEKIISLFKREAAILSELEDCGIPKGEANSYFTYHPEGEKRPCHCLVMEKINGPNLEEWLKQRANQPISEKQAITWLTQLVEILAKLHEQNYVHRDIKPANVMLRLSTETGITEDECHHQLVLIDFGAVKQVTASYIAGSDRSTRLGSPGYIAPEQDVGKVVPQSDFFALGRTLVHLLTGKHPMDIGQDYETSKLDWRNLAPQISSPLADLLDELMSPSPKTRPQTAQKIKQGLEKIINPPAPSQALINISGLHLLVLVNLVILVILLIVSSLFWQAKQKQHEFEEQTGSGRAAIMS